MTITETQPRTIGDLLRQWRDDSGFTIEQMATLIEEKAPWLRRKSREYVRRQELGIIQANHLDLPYLIVACEILKHSPSELGEDIAEAVANIAQLTAAKPRKGPKGAKTGSRCFEPPATVHEFPARMGNTQLEDAA